MAWVLHGILLESIWNPYTIQMEYIDCEACVKPFLTLQECITFWLWMLGAGLTEAMRDAGRHTVEMRRRGYGDELKDGSR